MGEGELKQLENCLQSAGYVLTCFLKVLTEGELPKVTRFTKPAPDRQVHNPFTCEEVGAVFNSGYFKN